MSLVCLLAAGISVSWSPLRAVIGAKDAENAVLRAELEAQWKQAGGKA